MNNKERTKWIDICKGIGIILVIFGHTSLASELMLKIIYSFHMPLFFFISGYLFRPKKISEWFISRGKRLVLPYVVWGGILFFSDIFIFRLSWESVISHTIKYYCGMSSEAWFLLALFETELIFLIIVRLFKNKLVQLCTVLVIGGIGHIFCLVQVNLPWFITTAMVQVTMLSLGWIFKEYKLLDTENDSQKNNIVVCIVFIVLNIIVCSKNELVSVLFMRYGALPLYYAGAIAGIAATICISKFIKQSKVLEMLGRNTLLLYLTNIYIPTVLREFIDGVLVKIISVIILCIICFGADKIKVYGIKYRRKKEID